MRSRNLKPGFFKNEDLADCSPWERLCFAGLWLLADREGRLQDRPKRIKAELFAFDSVEVEPMLASLEHRGFIERYAANGLGIIQIINFSKHQNPHHREPESDLPCRQSPGLLHDARSAKPEATSALHDNKAQGKPEASPGQDPPRVDLARGSSRADSGFLIPDSGVNTARGRAARNRKSPLPDDFAISERVSAWAGREGHGQLDAHLAAFIAKCKAHDYRYVDWDAAFMEAVREDWAKLRKVGGNGSRINGHSAAPSGPSGALPLYVPPPPMTDEQREASRAAREKALVSLRALRSGSVLGSAA